MRDAARFAGIFGAWFLRRAWFLRFQAVGRASCGSECSVLSALCSVFVSVGGGGILPDGTVRARYAADGPLRAIRGAPHSVCQLSLKCSASSRATLWAFS
ncbi:hypothetical protein GCM10027091_52370 [Streptomyces daliensis]